ncbi:MAG: (2Fe-2S) ferredoxin domain-containing protein, partial [Clostridia bacterium]|nr:(2Fe-2S) ferredoxin domain-containing protein [Clostridia bacterium]
MLKTRQELQELRRACEAAFASQKSRILVCTGTGCASSGSLDIYARLVELMKEKGVACSVELSKDPHSKDLRVTKGGCPGFCEFGPLVRIEPQGWLYTKVQLSDCEEIVSETILKGNPIERLAYQRDGKIYVEKSAIPFYQKQRRLVLEHC